jgi:hypothetical protein
MRKAYFRRWVGAEHARVVGEELCIAAERRLACGGTEERTRLEGGGHAALSTIVAGLGML